MGLGPRLQAAALWIWHAPGLFQAGLTNKSIHQLQHLSFLVSALLFWWVLVYGRQGVRGYGSGVLSVFTTALHSGALGALLTFAVVPCYQAYQGDVAFWGVTAWEDQQLAGLMMWVPAGILHLCAGLGLLAGGLHALEAKEPQRKRCERPQRRTARNEQPSTPRRRQGTVARMLLGGSLVTLIQQGFHSLLTGCMLAFLTGRPARTYGLDTWFIQDPTNRRTRTLSGENF
jgi:hypothetical protein